MADEADLRKLRVSGALCRFTGKPTGPEELIHLHAELGSGTKSHGTCFTTPDRLKTAFHPSIDVDFDDPDEEDGGS